MRPTPSSPQSGTGPRDDLRAYAAVHPWTDEAKRAFYPALVKAAARILFVPLLLALATG
jgi:hypothetical protein